MTDLGEFLLARIAEDEAVARAEVERLRGAPRRGGKTTAARVLAECEAKRRIIVRCQEMQLATVPMAVHLASRTLADLALPYADHPDYRDEWRP